MRTHILMTVLALTISACASYHNERVPASTKAQESYNMKTPGYNHGGPDRGAR